MSKRVIRIIGSIDEAAFGRFCDELDALEALRGSPVTLELSSDGGNAYDALAFSARMRASPCAIKVIAYGLVASAAVLVLASGTTRLMSKESWVMVHEDSGKLSGSVADLERESAHLRRMEIQWAKLLAERTLVKASFWEELHAATTYLSAEECLNLGLIDKII